MISGNGDAIFFNGSEGDLIQGNFIGTDVTGTVLLGNAVGVGVLGVGFSTIGGTTPGAGNLISGSGIAGVLIRDADNTAILSNSIDSNRFGIDLLPDGAAYGPTPNTPGGFRIGPNGFQNFPVLSSVVAGAHSTTITGTLNSTPDTAFTIQLFASAVADTSGFGEGQTYLGQVTNVTTDGSGNASFTAVVAAEPSGQSVITATATDPNGNTSEFSQALIPSPPPAPIPFTVTNTNDTGPGSLRQAILNVDALVRPSAASPLPSPVRACTPSARSPLPTIFVPGRDSTATPNPGRVRTRCKAATTRFSRSS